jgi:nicotinate-nucleotide--dimethylbenzimidazole phosphoribosyltransferase
MRKAAAVRDAARRGRPVAGDIVDLVACVGSADIAAMAGFLAQSAARRTPVVLDGVMSCVAALIVQRFAFAATEWFIAGHRSPEPSQAIALQRLGLEPLVDYQLRLGEGTGALIALPIIVAAADTLRDMATFSEAGVTDREPADAGASAALDAT